MQSTAQGNDEPAYTENPVATTDFAFIPQLRGFHIQIPKQLPKRKTIALLHDQGNQQETFAPLLDSGICSQRMKQYLYHMRNYTHVRTMAFPIGRSSYPSIMLLVQRKGGVSLNMKILSSTLLVFSSLNLWRHMAVKFVV